MIWMIRAGEHGEHEQKFIQDSRVYVTWKRLCVDLMKLAGRNDLIRTINALYPDSKPRTVANWVGQIWPFAHEMKSGDIVMVPLKTQPAIQIGEIAGDYHFESAGPDPYFHWRPVNWIGEAIPRANFGRDLLFSLGPQSICRVQSNNAEIRIDAMRTSGWKPETAAVIVGPPGMQIGELEDGPDIEELASDQIAQLINARFKGHGLARLVEGILKAQGYTTYLSPEGADGGADILAGAGPLGFAAPRLCVEVKSEDSPIDRPTVDKLLGAVQKFGATEGLFVSWGGFKGNVQKELAAQFFRVRLWTRKELFEQLFAYYDRLDEDLRADLPLKRIWTVAVQDEE
ncbi:MAG TPA: restriction endonuclease [Bryobacteraceae bacterium]|jgi:restriction system protein